MRRPQAENIESNSDAEPKHADNWLTRANAAWDVSDSYYTTNLQNRMVRNQLLFDSKHPHDSKYRSDAYKYRSKLFRPKIRTASRKTEAAGVQAFFSTLDCIEVAPQNEKDQQQVISAAVNAEALKHHLNNTIPWFLTCIGGLQDAFKVGVVCSFQSWKKVVRRYKVKVPKFNPDGSAVTHKNGKAVYDEEMREEVIEDRPDVELFPFRYLRFHPAAAWIDPMNTSPFVCRIIPMYVYQIKARMHENTPEVDRWTKLTAGQMKAAKMETSTDAEKQAQDGGKEDPMNVQTAGVDDYDISIVLQWFMISPEDGQRYMFYTLGTRYRLSEPVLIKKNTVPYPHGKVPITYGFMILEAHKNVPTSGPEMGEGLNKEANNLANARLDNVLLVLNKRFIVKRGRQVDVRSLVMNAPASVTFATDPETDVKAMEFNDVTASAYQEQSRIDNDSDELLGNFSQSSIQSNRSMNDTVGGMQLLAGTTGQTQDYNLKTFVETWMEPTLRQTAANIQFFESDEKVLGIAAGRAKLPEDVKAGMGEPNEEMMDGEFRLTVNVGVGASNPLYKAQQFIAAVKQLTEILVMLREAQVNGVQVQEIAKELFGYIGYKDASRFFSLDENGQVDPNVQALEAEVQRLTQLVENEQLKIDGQKAIKQLELQQQTASERKQRDHEWNLEQSKQRHETRKALIEVKNNREEIASKERIAKDANKTTRETAEAAAAAAKAKAKKTPAKTKKKATA